MASLQNGAFLATDYESVRIRIGTTIPNLSLRIIIIFYNLLSIRLILLHLSFGPLTGQHMARPWESSLHFEPTTLPHSSSNMSSRLCSKGSSGASFVCYSVPASLSTSDHGGCCSSSSTLVCSSCTGSSPLPSGSRCSTSVPGSFPSPM